MQGNHTVCISNRERVEIDSVTCVRSFDDDGVLLESSMGMISVDGRELRIENFEKATSKILIVGQIFGVYYLEKRHKKKGRVNTL